jgi:hypothetical protein
MLDAKPGLSQKPGLAPGHQKIFSFFNSFKKLQSNFLKELKKENKVSCRRQSSGLLRQALRR